MRSVPYKIRYVHTVDDVSSYIYDLALDRNVRMKVDERRILCREVLMLIGQRTHYHISCYGALCSHLPLFVHLSVGTCLAEQDVMEI